MIAPRLGRLALFDGPNRPLRSQAHAVPKPDVGEWLVRVRYCTLCGSDVHTFAGRRPSATPLVLGHEILGEIAAFGPDAARVDFTGQPVREGDRVTWSVAANCGTCFFCTHDLPQKCERLFKYGHETWSAARPFTGGLGEYVVLVAGTALLRVPPALPDRVACLCNCATATVAAALRRAGGCRGQVVLVQGAGTLGLTACALAKHLGAAAVLCCDPDPERCARAADFGATRLLSTDPEALRAGVAEMTNGRGADLILEMSGSADAVETGITLLRTGGVGVLVGTVLPTRRVAIDPEQMVRRMLSVHGVHNYAPVDLATALRFLEERQGAHPFADLVVRELPLVRAEEAFRLAEAHPGRRVGVVP